MSVIPFGDRVLAKRDEPEAKTKGGLVIPDVELANKKKEVQIATVIRKGPDCMLDLKEGDRIYFDKYAPNAIKAGDEDLILVEQKAVLAKIA